MPGQVACAGAEGFVEEKIIAVERVRCAQAETVSDESLDSHRDFLLHDCQVTRITEGSEAGPSEETKLGVRLVTFVANQRFSRCAARQIDQYQDRDGSLIRVAAGEKPLRGRLEWQPRRLRHGPSTSLDRKSTRLNSSH